MLYYKISIEVQIYKKNCQTPENLENIKKRSRFTKSLEKF